MKKHDKNLKLTALIKIDTINYHKPHKYNYES